MKNIYIISIFLITFCSCSSDSGPLLDVNIVCTKSSEYQQAKFDFGIFRLFQAGSGVSNIQDWSGNICNLNLTESDTSEVLSRFHWSLDLTGVKPDFSLQVMKDGEWNYVKVAYLDRINLENDILLENNGRYEILINVDIDNALVETADNIELDWNYVTVEAK